MCEAAVEPTLDSVRVPVETVAELWLALTVPKLEPVASIAVLNVELVLDVTSEPGPLDVDRLVVTTLLDASELDASDGAASATSLDLRPSSIWNVHAVPPNKTSPNAFISSKLGSNRLFGQADRWPFQRAKINSLEGELGAQFDLNWTRLPFDFRKTANRGL